MSSAHFAHRSLSFCSLIATAIVLHLFFLTNGCYADGEIYSRLGTAATAADSEERAAPSSALSALQKRSWQSLQGSWGKRGANNDMDHEPVGTDDLAEYEMNLLLSIDPTTMTAGDPLQQQSIAQIVDYLEPESMNLQKWANWLHSAHAVQQQQQQSQLSGEQQKRGWKSMSGAWGKRLGSGDWNRFRGSWGKREPAWNNLKGLWGKRAAANANNWNKLQSAWGKRSDQF